MLRPEFAVLAAATAAEHRGAQLVIPTLDGGSVKVAPHASYGQMDDADRLDHNVARADLEPINAAVAELLPGLVPTPVRVAAYMDAYTSDGHALVGQMPGTSNVWLLGAFSGTRIAAVCEGA